jgi:hypothetical protein
MAAHDGPRLAQSENVRDCVDRAGARALLAGEAFGKLATITLALRLERDQVTHTNATITPNAVEQNLASIQQLVQVGAAHAEALSSLVRSQHGPDVDNRELRAVARGTTQRKQNVAQFGTSACLRELLKRIKLRYGNVGCLDSHHTGRSTDVTSDPDVTDDSKPYLVN